MTKRNLMAMADNQFDISDEASPLATIGTEEEKILNDQHRATLTCFVQTADEQKCALISGHVSRRCDGNVYYRKQCMDSNCLGVCMSGEKRWRQDAVMIALCDKVRDLSENNVFDPNKCQRTWKVFDGDHSTLYGREVFKCIPLWKRIKNETIWKTSLTGKIASHGIHENHRESLGNHSFLVNQDACVSFAVEGESGTLLAVDTCDTDVHLVGYICGKFKSKEECRPNFILCEFLSVTLKDLSLALQTQLTVCASSDTSGSRADTIDCGSTIYVRHIEHMGEIDFEIDEQILYLFNINFETDDSSSLNFIRKCERQFRDKVFAREQINEMAIYEPDRAEKVTLLYFYITVQNLYAQNHDGASASLRRGIRALVKVRQSQLRLVCKCVTYVTWLYLDSDDMAKAKKILKEGLGFFEETEDLPHFPTECLAYHYYDLSRYYVIKQNKVKAVSMAKKCFDSFDTMLKKHIDSKPSNIYTDLFNRWIFGACIYGETLLWCGENFEYAECEVSESCISEADFVIKRVENSIEQAPAVQKCQYLLVKCDLHYRKQEYVLAYNVAKECFELAKQHNIGDEQCSAGKRCVALRKLKAHARMKKRSQDLVSNL